MILIQIFGMWGKTAINIFTLITGYFMVKNNPTVRKILKIVLETVFYVYGFYIIFLITGYEPFSVKEVIKQLLFLPLEVGNLYTDSMIAMMIFIPFCNMLIKAISKKQYQILLSLLLIYFTVLASFLKNDNFDFVFWMLTMYFIGGYIRLYSGKIDNLKVGVVCSVVSIVAMIVSIILIDFIGNRIGITDAYYFLSDANKILAVTTSISVFIMFKNLKINYNKIINILASTTFGVLLIHANTAAMRRFLWVDVFNNMGHYNSKYFIIYACAVVVLVYGIAVIIDLLRKKFVEFKVFRYLDKYEILHKILYNN